MKYLIFILLISCTSNVETVKFDHKKIIDSTEKAIEEQIKPIDRIGLSLKYLDSNRHYYRLALDNERLANKAQLDYLASGGEKKYERRFYKYDNLRVKYAKICNKWDDSLKNNK